MGLAADFFYLPPVPLEPVNATSVCKEADHIRTRVSAGQTSFRPTNRRFFPVKIARLGPANRKIARQAVSLGLLGSLRAQPDAGSHGGKAHHQSQDRQPGQPILLLHHLIPLIFLTSLFHYTTSFEKASAPLDKRKRRELPALLSIALGNIAAHQLLNDVNILPRHLLAQIGQTDIAVGQVDHPAVFLPFLHQHFYR